MCTKISFYKYVSLLEFLYSISVVQCILIWWHEALWALRYQCQWMNFKYHDHLKYLHCTSFYIILLRSAIKVPWHTKNLIWWIDKDFFKNMISQKKSFMLALGNFFQLFFHFSRETGKNVFGHIYDILRAKHLVSVDV